jgi:D-aminopeptidase
VRARDLGIEIGRLTPGPLDSIGDVAGVRVGHTTLIEGEGPLEVGRGPVRTGVTVIVPHDGDIWREPLFAGCHRLNGNGELTGLEWIRESGLLGGAIGLTNTHSVGVVHDALIAAAARSRADEEFWSLPVVGETYDGALNDMNGFHVRPEHVDAALAGASSAVAEGSVGGGTGMICHEFKGGIGTASRRIDRSQGGWTVGVLVQANYGRRELLRIDGVPVGREISVDELPSPWDQLDAISHTADRSSPDGGSIIVVVATDAPLLPHQCARVAQRPALGLGRMGSYASHSSGDLFLAFATGNRNVSQRVGESDPRLTAGVSMVVDAQIDPLFEATVEATEEAVVNALLAAETMTGRDGVTAPALPHDRLREVMKRYGRLQPHR